MIAWCEWFAELILDLEEMAARAIDAVVDFCLAGDP